MRDFIKKLTPHEIEDFEKRCRISQKTYSHNYVRSHDPEDLMDFEMADYSLSVISKLKRKHGTIQA